MFVIKFKENIHKTNQISSPTNKLIWLGIRILGQIPKMFKMCMEN